MTARFHDAADSMGAPGRDGPGPYDEMSGVLAGLPRPRPVRMSRRGKSTAVLVAVILIVSMTLFFVGLSAQSKATGGNAGLAQSLKFALPIVFIFVIVPLMLGQVTRQKPLLAQGEIALAKVTDRRWARHGATIRYEFTTQRGEHFSRTGPDGTGQLSAGMTVPVFYDPQRPKKQLALCASFYEVILPGE